MKRRGALAAFILGLVFGIALGPCTFAYMAPMLGVALGLAATNLAYGILLLLAYGIGHCSVIVLAGTCTELVQRYLHWTERSRGTAALRAVCGILVILGGLNDGTWPALPDPDPWLKPALILLAYCLVFLALNFFQFRRQDISA